MRRTTLVLLLALAAAAAIHQSLPARPATLPTAFAWLPDLARGAFHVHTRQSDGSGTVAEVAAAAARAGLQFVILTDHGDAAREPATPYYSSGVLCIEAVEISTEGGHVVALGLPRAPYPLGGEARDVVEDIDRLGGFSIAAHPGSEKPELKWVEWAAPIDGLEWLNGDSEWRDEPVRALARVLFTYPFRRSETLATVLDRPDAVLRRWDVLTGRRPVVAVAGADAHARVGLRGEPDDGSIALHLPGYETVFRTFSITVSSVRLTGDAAADARAVLGAIRQGHVYSSIDALAGPAAMSFSATHGAVPLRAEAGDVIAPGGSGIPLRVESNAPEQAEIVLLKDGTPQARARGSVLEEVVPAERAVYRVEIRLPGAPGAPPVPWVVSNPIYVGIGREAPPARVAAAAFAPQYENGPAADWTVATSPRSQGALDVVPAEGGTQLAFRWGLGGTRSESPYAAIVMPAGPALGGHDRLMFTGRADRPMRLSVQLRVPAPGDGERWHRSVYLDETARDVTIFFDDMTPRGPTTTRRAPLADVRDVMFVVDTVNTAPGTSGEVRIDEVRYAR